MFGYSAFRNLTHTLAACTFVLLIPYFGVSIYSFRKWISYPLVKSAMEMRSLWLSKTYLYNATSLSIRKYFNRGVLDISKDVLWVSVGQRTAKLQAVKVGDLRKILLHGRTRTKRGRPGFESWTIRSSSKFDSPQLCSPLIYRDSQYLFWKI